MFTPRVYSIQFGVIITSPNIYSNFSTFLCQYFDTRSITSRNFAATFVSANLSLIKLTLIPDIEVGNDSMYYHCYGGNHFSCWYNNRFTFRLYSFVNSVSYIGKYKAELKRIMHIASYINHRFWRYRFVCNVSSFLYATHHIYYFIQKAITFEGVLCG